MINKFKPFISLFIIIALVAFTVFLLMKVNNCKAYSVDLSKSEYQLHRFWYFVDDSIIPSFWQCTTSNTLRAAGSYVNSTLINFYYDDWRVIVTEGTANVDPYATYYPEDTEYFDSYGNSICKVYFYQRTTYSVWLQPDWIRLCSSYANLLITAPTGGHVTGSVNGRFKDPPGYPISIQVFLATTTIPF